MSEWFEDEAFWTAFYPSLFSAERFEAAEQDVTGILEMAGLEEGRVLDLACGPGRHSTELAKRGLDVTGVDLSPFLLRKARERASEEGVNVEWVRQDMRRFVRPDSFDLVINMFTSFGYFGDRSDDLLVLRNVLMSLREGGALIMDVLGKETLARKFLETTSKKLPDGRMLVQRHEIVRDWNRVDNTWIVIDGDLATTYRFDHAVYSGQELREMLLEVGFSSVCLFGGVDRSDYGLNASRLIALARR